MSLVKYLLKCKIVIVLIGENSITPSNIDPEGRDYFADEINLAIQLNKAIMPVFINGEDPSQMKLHKSPWNKLQSYQIFEYFNCHKKSLERTKLRPRGQFSHIIHKLLSCIN